MTGGIAVVLRRRKYAVLLTLLCVALAIETFSARRAERFLSDAVATVLALAIWFVVFERRNERAVMGATLIATNPEVAALLSDWFGRSALFTYYAYAQVLTLGYSDVTPIRAPATTLSLFAALFGVFYTAIVVSVFVGLAQSAKGGRGKE